jgi:hypothetical protein
MRVTNLRTAGGLLEAGNQEEALQIRVSDTVLQRDNRGGGMRVTNLRTGGGGLQNERKSER